MIAAFLINDRFLVSPDLQTVTDRNNGRKIRIEPRLMHLLCLLAANAGRLLTRERLINDIWNDHGGADKALTQAISFLRKLLDEKGKPVIETVGTKGYVLTADIADPTKETKQTSTPLKLVQQPWRIITAAVLVVALGLILFWGVTYRETANLQQPSQAAKSQPHLIANPGIKKDSMPALPSKRTSKRNDNNN